MVCTSNAERDAICKRLTDTGMTVMSYGGERGISAKEAATLFRDGAGDVLVGTAANYAEGTDLPAQVAPVIFFLKPGYPPGWDPQLQFERQRYGRGAWALQTWRLMLKALQVRGRNVRSAQDLGVCIFLDGRFRFFLQNSLPDWLKPSYRRGLTMDQCVEDALQLLSPPADDEMPVVASG